MPNQVNLSGFKELQAKMARLPAKIKDEANEEVFFAAQNWEARAKDAAPVDTGRLRGEILARRVKPGEAEVVVNIEYAPYVEWGTGSKVRVPTDLASYALQFKGRKIVPGIRPRPYFFPQKPIIEQEFIQALRNILKTLD